MLPQKILMVDDRPENLIALDALLEGDGREIIKAFSGEEALKLLIKHDFSLILLDVQMPGMDGFEVAELARANKKIQKVPIIFVTAISKEDHYKFRGYEVGAVDYLTKPIDPMIIQSKVNFFLELDKQKRVLEEKIRQSREYIRAYQESKNNS